MSTYLMTSGGPSGSRNLLILVLARRYRTKDRRCDDCEAIAESAADSTALRIIGLGVIVE